VARARAGGGRRRPEQPRRAGDGEAAEAVGRSGQADANSGRGGEAARWRRPGRAARAGATAAARAGETASGGARESREVSGRGEPGNGPEEA
jgi:hypothetical protein